MLTDQEQREIDELLAHYEQPRAAAAEALMAVQRHRRWVSDETLRDVAQFLDLSPEELDSVATAFNLIFRRPVGKHVILMCDSVSCWILGQNPLTLHLTARLGIRYGETTPDGLFTLLPVACLGACDHAPAMMIDDELYGDLDAAKLDGILDEYRKS
jgi:NADH-quinone oxidoreductase subunit E